MYDNCRLYGPYTSKQDGRKRMVIVFPNKRMITVSYPKYIMENHLGRYLDDDETVDHIDRDFDNNNISNLQILSPGEHTSKDAKRLKDIEIQCSYCGKYFTIFAKGANNRFRKSKDYTFCSKRCAGMYGNDIQNGRPVTLIKVVAIKEYYYLDK